jgi:hypothetical protein
MVNCRIYDNFGPTGSAVTCAGDGTSAVVGNCTIFNNQGIGVEAYTWSTATRPTVELFNTVVWGNAGAFRLVGLDNLNQPPRILASHCDVQGGYPGLGNVAVDPLLANPASGNLRLLPSSPCRDAGVGSAPDLPPTDFEGDSRVIGKAVDIGADELNPLARLLWGDRGQLSLAAGGSPTFRLLGGSNQVFVLLPSLSGTEPGFDFPWGLHVPINLDAATSYLLGTLPGFLGVCDAAGSGQTTLRFPALPAYLEGLDLSFAAVLLRGAQPESASNFERLRLVK